MARKQKTIHYLYKTTCLVTGRYYIGMHSTCKLDDGYMGSGLRLRRSIRKYGVDNHVKEILEFFETREELASREQEIVTFELIEEELCMNLVAGGNGGYISKEGVKKGRVKCDEILKEKYGENFLSDIIKKYHNNLTEEQKLIRGKNISKGQKDSEFDFGSTFRDKRHSNESKQKIGDAKKGTGSGENNSQYGTCWITKDGVNKKIRKEELDKWVNNNWNKGRK